MRPKLLEIEGLQSFTDVQRIDFEALGETGLFGIFGPTGSGKSSILDAITFALYGKVKRAEGGTQGIINSRLETARVAFTFDLTNGGIKKTYRVERVYRRRKNSLNSCEPKVVRLIEVAETAEIPLCDKAMEVSYYIRDLLGLNSDDFTRAVVLPQNSFQEFLLLNNQDRRGMLERIFYLEEYGRELTDKLGRKMARLKSRLDVLSGELMGYADASGEALEEAKKAVDTAMAERSRVEKEAERLEVKFNEAREVWGLVGELTDLNRKEEEHAALGNAVSAKRLRLERAIKAEGLPELIQKHRESVEKLKETDRQMEEVMSVLPGVIKELHDAKAGYESVKCDAAKQQPALLGLRVRLADALEIKNEIAAITGKITALRGSANKQQELFDEKSGLIKKGTTELDVLGKNIGLLGQEINSFKIDPEYRQKILDGAGLEKEVLAQEASIKELEGRAAALKSSASGLEQKLCSIRKAMALSLEAEQQTAAEKHRHETSDSVDKNTVMKAVERIHSVKQVYQILKLRENDLEHLKTKHKSLQADYGNVMKKVQALNRVKDEVAETYAQCRRELDESIDGMYSGAAAALSKNLKDGEPCPVCGSIHHPRPAAALPGDLDPAETEFSVEAAKEKLANAEKALRIADANVIAADERVKTITGQIAQTVKELELKHAQYDEERQKLPEKFKAFSLEQIQNGIEKAEAEYTEKLKAIEEWEVKQRELNESLKKLSDDATAYRLSENSVATELKVNGENIEQLEKSLTKARKISEGSRRLYKDFLEKYGIDSAGAELRRFAENDRKSNVLQKDMDKKREEADNKRNLLVRLEEELQLINAGRIKLEADEGALKTQRMEKGNKLKELAGEADIEQEIRNIDKRLDEYESTGKKLESKLQFLEKRHNELQTQKSLLESQRRIYSEGLENDELRLKAALAEKGFIDGDDAENSIIPPDRKKELKEELDEYDRIAGNIKAQKGMLLKKLKSRSISEEEWNGIKNAYAQMIKYKEACVSGSEVAKSRYDALNSKHGKWVELKKDYNEQSHRQGLFEQIQKLLKAEHRKDNSFIDYIAEERLRYVAAKASATLGMMTKFRYALELDTEAGFIIRDQLNGGAHRMVTSLSGGETFLTSLSLALALSEQIQLKGQSPLEFFFLDEGFGMLDQDLLDMVIDSLERLSSSERVIGLISHVPEMRSRISRRLIVEPPALHGDGSRVVIERA